MTETEIKQQRPFVTFAIKLVLYLPMISLFRVFSFMPSSNLLYSDPFIHSGSILCLILPVKLSFPLASSLSLLSGLLSGQ